jgi:hypothetical protein
VRQPGRDSPSSAPDASRPEADGPPDVLALLELQQTSGNALVSALLAREPQPATATAPPAGGQQPPAAPAPPPPATVPPRKNYVFLMGDVKNDNFYKAADEFFKQHEKGAELVTGKRTLAEIIQHVNAGGVPVLKLFIVSHANEEGNLGFSLDPADLQRDTAGGDHKARTEYHELSDANKAQSLPTADVKLIDDFTKVEIKGCNIGRSQLMLDALDTAFGGHAEVIAPTHKQEYSVHGGKGGVVSEEALFQYSVEEPGAPTKDPSAVELQARFAAKYPNVPADKWKGLMKKVKKDHVKKASFTWRGVNPPKDEEKDVVARLDAAKRFPKAAGWVLTYNGRTVVGDHFHYELHAERVKRDGSTEFNDLTIDALVPPEPSALEAQEKASSGRPDAYTWTVEDEISGTTLVRRVFKERTEWTIDEKIVDATGVAHPAETDPTFYGHSHVQPPPAPATPPATP